MDLTTGKAFEPVEDYPTCIFRIRDIPRNEKHLTVEVNTLSGFRHIDSVTEKLRDILLKFFMR